MFENALYDSETLFVDERLRDDTLQPQTGRGAGTGPARGGDPRAAGRGGAGARGEARFKRHKRYTRHDTPSRLPPTREVGRRTPVSRRS